MPLLHTFRHRDDGNDAVSCSSYRATSSIPTPLFVAFQQPPHEVRNHASIRHGPHHRSRGLPPLQPDQGGSSGSGCDAVDDDDISGDEWSPRLAARQRHRRQGECCNWRLLLALDDNSLSCRGAVDGEKAEEEGKLGKAPMPCFFSRASKTRTEEFFFWEKRPPDSPARSLRLSLPLSLTALVP